MGSKFPMRRGKLAACPREISNVRDRIKRSELFDADNSPHSSPSASPIIAERDPDYGFEYDFITAVSSAPDIAPVSREADMEEEYQFRLFTAGPRATPGTVQPGPSTKATIRLSLTPPPTALTESWSLDKAQFVRPNRPDSYYFTSATPHETKNIMKAEYADVAVSASDVLFRAQSTKWPGTALPWRLIHVQLVNPGNNSRYKSLPPSSVSKDVSHAASRLNRKRPSKKRRILLRRRLALRADMAAQVKATQESEQEKRTRRNREKKVKRKEREKKKKLVSGDGQEDRESVPRETAKGQDGNEPASGEGSADINSATKPDLLPSGATQQNTDEPTLPPAKTPTTTTATTAPTRRRPPTARAPT